MSNINVQMHDENNNNLFPYTYAENVFDQNGHRLEDLLNNLMTGDIVSAAYSASKTYAVGDYCIYSNTLYRCTTAITTAEAWNSNHWTATDAGTELALKMNKANPVGTGSFSLNRKANTTVGSYSTAEGYNCTASASNAHAEGSSTVASGSTSHAEGYQTTASGESSHAEGYQTTASGSYGAHAEGYDTSASSVGAHAEGANTTANGNYSHAEGNATTASGRYSHTEGLFTTAQRQSQHVFGEYNVLDTAGTAATRGNYVEIVGNGDSSARSNARTLDWSGNEVLAGTLTTTDVNKPTGSTWDGTNASLATAITSLNSTLNSNLLKSKDVAVTVGTTSYDGYYIVTGDTGLSTSSKLVSVQVIGSSNNHAAFVGFYEQNTQKFRVNCVASNVTVYVRIWYI